MWTKKVASICIHSSSVIINDHLEFQATINHFMVSPICVTCEFWNMAFWVFNAGYRWPALSFDSESNFNLRPMSHWRKLFGFNTVAPNMFSGMRPSRRPWKRKWTKWLTLSRVERPSWRRWTWRRLGVLGAGSHERFHVSITVIIATTFIPI